MENCEWASHDWDNVTCWLTRDRNQGLLWLIVSKTGDCDNSEDRRDFPKMRRKCSVTMSMIVVHTFKLAFQVQMWTDIYDFQTNWVCIIRPCPKIKQAKPMTIPTSKWRLERKKLCYLYCLPATSSTGIYIIMETWWILIIKHSQVKFQIFSKTTETKLSLSASNSIILWCMPLFV